MFRFLAAAFFTLFVCADVMGAAPQQRRGGGNGTVAAKQTVTSNARSAVRGSVATGGGAAVSARAATNGRNTVARGAAPVGASSTSARSATVAARAGSTQKVIGAGTKVAAAGENVASNDICAQKFNGCMDTFCMNENTSGGRCICSSSFADFEKQLAEIEKLDQHSYQLATVGVETIETGVNVAAVKERGKKSGIDMSLWENNAGTPEIEEDIRNKKGASLFSAAVQFCEQQIPECKDSFDMNRMLYNQHIKSDCAAYQNALKEQRRLSENRKAEAERALRDAALEQLRTANKYDLGQCTVEFKKCMITTGGCGEDFSQCASVAAFDSTNVRQSTSKKAKNYTIKGSATNIEISASTYDTLEAKKPLCMNITNSCVAVKDQVWDTFLREVAPQIKSAELIAEDNARQNCIGSISSCFQKACKDTMDPNDPDGSYDMCLSRPGTMLNVCKVPLNACGIDASSAAKAEESAIWSYVLARLASMRVDSCTTEVKECLQSEDRCGKDYTQCVGLDTDTIIRMCPYDKLVGCQKVYGDKGEDIRGDAVYDELSNMVQGIMLGIDNNMLTFCQNAANEAMIKVCGDTKNCNGLAVDENIGAGSLEYKICEYKFDGEQASIDYSKCRTNISQISDQELGRVPGSTTGELGPVTPFVGLLDGVMFWEQVTVDDKGFLTGPDEYFASTGSVAVRDEKKKEIEQQILRLQNSINNTIQAIESDPTVQFCITGREVQGMKDRPVSGAKVARFPELTKQMRSVIAASALKIAKENYYKVYDAQYEQLMQDYVKIAERQAEIKGENAKDVRREMARYSCISLADMASLPMSPPPPTGWGAWLVAGIVAAAAIVTAVFTGGGSLVAAGAFIASLSGQAAATFAAAATVSAAVAGSAVVGVGVVGMAAVGAAAGAIAGGITQASISKNNGDSNSAVARELSGHHELNQWNWKQVIDTTFDWETLNCRKCVRSTKCIKQSYPLFGMPKCKQWAESTDTCTDTQF